jgi:hypothetical protein
MTMNGKLGASGTLVAKMIPGAKAPVAWRLKNTMRWSFVWGWLANSLAKLFTAITGVPTMTAELKAVLIKNDGSTVNYGVLGRRVVTTAFVNFMTDQLQAETSQWGDFKFHDSGVGTTAENAADTGMETTDGEDRVTGTQAEGASANIYSSVGTISYTTSKAITEHGLFSQATGTTLMDRTVFSAINVVSGDSIQFTYQLTTNSGS